MTREDAVKFFLEYLKQKNGRARLKESRVVVKAQPNLNLYKQGSHRWGAHVSDF